MESEHIFLIINKHLTGELSEQEQHTLQHWLQQSEENRTSFDRLSQIWDTTGKMSLDLDIDTESAWRRVALKTELPENSRFSLWSNPLMKIAASVIFLITLGTIYFLLAPVNKTVYRTEANERKQVVLPDNSQVWLNQNATLTFARNFEHGRDLELDGEAFFEVTHDPEHPFTVRTSSILTTVLGTSFSVNETDENPVAEVIVASGQVKVNPIKSPTEAVVLEPGTKAHFQKNSGILSKSGNSNRNFLAWKERTLKFQNTSITDLEKTLEDYFDISIDLENEKLGTCQLTSDFRDPTLEEVLEVLDMVLDITYSKQGEVYVLQGQGCSISQN